MAASTDNAEANDGECVDIVALAPRPAANLGGYATFWHGQLSPLGFTCLKSFARHGLPLKLFTYDRKIRVPEGVEIGDARLIVDDESLLSRYLVNGRPSLAKFSNLFRYRLLQQEDCCWVDADVLCLRPPEFLAGDIVIGRQLERSGPAELNAAVLQLPRAHLMLKDLAARAWAAVDEDSNWATLGPRLVTELARSHGLMEIVRPPSDFYPLPYDQFWKVVLPGYFAHCVLRTAQAQLMHLWNEMFERCGYDQNCAPPVGSFLHQRCEALDTLGEFQRVYDRREVWEMVRHLAE